MKMITATPSGIDRELSSTDRRWYFRAPSVSPVWRTDLDYRESGNETLIIDQHRRSRPPVVLDKQKGQTKGSQLVRKSSNKQRVEKSSAHHECVPQGEDVEGRRGAEAGEHGQPEVEGGRGAGRHRGGQLAQADPGGGSGWGGQLPDGARLQRGPVAVLLRVQGPDAPSHVQGEGVGRFEVGLPGGLGRGGAQQLLRVLEVGRVGNVSVAEGAFPKGGVRVDGHR